MMSQLFFRRRGSSSININFESGTLPPGVTFSRSSTGTYFDSAGAMQTAAANTARFDCDPSTLSLRGILIEPQRTNYLTYSAMPQTNWSLYNATKASSGDTYLSALTDGATATSTYSYGVIYPPNNYGQVSGETYARTVFVKAGTSGSISFYAGFSYIITGSLSGTLAVTTNSDGNTNLSLTKTGASSGYIIKDVFLSGKTQTAYMVRVGANASSSTINVYGAQFEKVGSGERAEATSFIPTTSAAVTRAADQLVFTVPSGISTLRYTFDDNSTQDVSVSSGTYTVPTTLNRAWIKRIQSL